MATNNSCDYAPTNHNVQVGGTSGTLTNVAPSATSGVPLVSGGSSANPSFTTAVVAGGGTGATTLTGVLIGNGTSAVTGNAVTNHNVLVGGTSNAITSVAPSATSGIPLVSSGSSLNPTFTTAVVAGGGTGATTFTSNGVLLGNTTSAITATAAGTTGQVLTGVTGSAPTWQSPAASGITTISGDSGSATGSTVKVSAGNSAISCGATVKFVASGTSDTLAVTDSNDNTVVGKSAGTATITGTSNTGLGSSSLHALSSGLSNTAVGFNSFHALTTGSSNVAIGNAAMQSTTDSTYDIAIGDSALLNYNSTGITANVAIGGLVMESLATGIQNIAIGFTSGSQYSGSESSNILLNSSGVAAESNVLRIGSATGTSATQINAAFICGIQGITVTGSPVIVSSSDQLGVAVSSAKFKENVEDMGDLSSNVLKLRPVSFNYKVGEDRSQQAGLIAEEVNEIMPSLVVYDKSGDPQTVKYHDLPALLLNELQKAIKRIEVLEKQLGSK